MSVSEKTGGSQTATITTEHTLATVTDPGTYVLGVDMGALAAGDIVELRIKTKMRSGGTSRLAYGPVKFEGVQTVPNKYSMPIPSDIEAVFTLKQTVGTGRAFPWSVKQL
jgi:hypothetical protein